MQSRQIAKGFLEFINSAVTPFHATESAKTLLTEKGFVEILEHEHWSLQPGQKYFFTRNQSSIYAFVVGSNFSPEKGSFRIIGTHTDSPCPKIAPVSKNQSHGIQKLNVQLYGGGLWHTWFDRDLTLAGRVIVESSGQLQSKLVHIRRPILSMPQLAIHLSKSRELFEYNRENNVKPLLGVLQETSETIQGDISKRHSSTLLTLIGQELEVDPNSIKDLELCVVDTNPARLTGINEEFISSPRLDNLMSTYCAIEALTEASETSSFISLWAGFDNEEIGSTSMQGADSIVLEQTMKRIIETLPGDKPNDAANFIFRKSFVVSADMAHAIHPNWPEKHQSSHAPKLGGGVVIKTNANQRYATDSVGASLIRKLCDSASVPVQEFIVRNDTGCGSTIGPFLASKAGVRTIDVGAPQFAMHSCRETMGVDDAHYYWQMMKALFTNEEELVCDAFLR